MVILSGSSIAGGKRQGGGAELPGRSRAGTGGDRAGLCGSLRCRMLGGTAGTAGLAECCITLQQGGCLTLQCASPRRERVTWSLCLQNISFGSACQKKQPWHAPEEGKAGAEGRWRAQVK